jgi:hypothetical protein
LSGRAGRQASDPTSSVTPRQIIFELCIVHCTGTCHPAGDTLRTACARHAVIDTSPQHSIAPPTPGLPPSTNPTNPALTLNLNLTSPGLLSIYPTHSSWKPFSSGTLAPSRPRAVALVVAIFLEEPMEPRSQEVVSDMETEQTEHTRPHSPLCVRQRPRPPLHFYVSILVRFAPLRFARLGADASLRVISWSGVGAVGVSSNRSSVAGGRWEVAKWVGGEVHARGRREMQSRGESACGAVGPTSVP